MVNCGPLRARSGSNMRTRISVSRILVTVQQWFHLASWLQDRASAPSPTATSRCCTITGSTSQRHPKFGRRGSQTHRGDTPVGSRRNQRTPRRHRATTMGAAGWTNTCRTGLRSAGRTQPRPWPRTRSHHCSCGPSAWSTTSPMTFSTRGPNANASQRHPGCRYPAGAIRGTRLPRRTARIPIRCPLFYRTTKSIWSLLHLRSHRRHEGPTGRIPPPRRAARHRVPPTWGCPLDTAVTGRIAARPWRHAMDYLEVATLWRHLGTAAFIVCAYLTGMRPSEILGLSSGCCPDPEPALTVSRGDT